MKKLAFSWLIIFLLFFSLTKAQMGFKPLDLSINTPQETNVYKKYTEGKTFLGISFGASIPFGDYGTNINAGMGLGLQAHYFINDHFAFGLSFGYYKSGLKDAYKSTLDTNFMIAAMNDTTGLKVLSVDGSSTLLPFTINVEYFFSPLKKFKPYVGLGLGYYVINYTIDVVTNKDKSADFRSFEALNGSNIDGNFGLTPYVGFFVDFNELLSMNFDVKYNQIFATPAASSLTVNLGLIFNLSYKY